MEWFQVRATELRARAVEAIQEMLKAAKKVQLVIDNKSKSTLVSYCDGSAKSHLEDADRSALELTLIGGDEPEQASVKRKGEPDITSKERPQKVLKRDSDENGARPTSKMAQLRQEHKIEKRLQANVGPTAGPVRVPSPELDDEPAVTFKMMATELSPESRPPKRPIQLLDEDKKVIDPNKRKEDLKKRPVPEKKPARAARNINDLYKFILKWEVDDSGDLPPAFDTELRPLPDRFTTVQEYGDYFEPLLLLECWEQFKGSREYVDFSKTGSWTVDNCLMLDEFHDLTFTQPADECRELGMADSDLVFLEQHTTALGAPTLKIAKDGDKGDKPRIAKSNKHTLAKIQSIQRRQGQSYIVARVFLHGRTHLLSAFYPNSRWSVVRLYSLTTVLREYTALTLLPKFLLSKEILSPVLQQKYRPDKNSVERVVRTFKVNQPQAEAIVAGSQRQSGFVLIQGPPGTGKTKTILGLIGALLTTVSNPIRVPGAKPAATTNQKKTRIMGKPFNPKVVRLGTSESISADIRDLTLESLFKTEIETDPEYLKGKADASSVDGQFNALVKHQAELQQEREALREKENDPGVVNKAGLDAKISVITAKLKAVDEKFKTLKGKKKEFDFLGDNMKSRIKVKILTGAEV
ncbi:DEAD-box type RNA helicase, partial [Cladochytrium tenue]